MTISTANRSRPVTTSREPGATSLWETEAYLVAGAQRDELLDRMTRLADYLDQHPEIAGADLAYSLQAALPVGGERLAVVAKSPADLRQKLRRAFDKLSDRQCDHIRDTSGIYYQAQPLGREGSVAFLFPGEGAHYPGMLRDLVSVFPTTQEFLAEADAALASVRGNEPPLSQLFVGPRSPELEATLQRLDNTMLGVLLADGVVHRVIQALGVEPSMVAGHSMGEMAALAAAGAAQSGEGFLDRFAQTMRQLEQQEATGDESVLLAVGAGWAHLKETVGDPAVYLAMDNCPHQTVLVGPPERMDPLEKQLQGRGLVCERLSFRRPYHTPLFESHLGPLRALFPTEHFRAPRLPVYSCTTARPFPADPEAIRELTVRHWAEPVRFSEMIRAMHGAGARLFVEVGPRGNLSAFVEDILRGERFAALPANLPRRSGLTQLNHLVAQLVAHHVPVEIGEFFRSRQPAMLDLPWQRATLPVSEPATEVSEPVVEATPAEGATGAVLQQYFAVMEQFLDVQAAVTEAYLRGAPQTPPPAVAEPEATPQVRPLLGEIVREVAGQEVVVRRRLDLREDLFALDHTVGGRMVSRVDPEQHGVPVMPMTFMLEILAETAGVLAPGLVAVGLRAVRLLRWLAFEFDEPAIIEVSAKLEGPREGGGVLVRAEIREVGPEHQPHPNPLRVAQGQVLFAPHYEPAPQAVPLPGEQIRPIEMTVDEVYHNLFHGPRFQGVRRTLRGSDNSIEAEIEVLPRGELFLSVPEPAFHLDPVMLDVVLHPLATWHLHQPDLAGRIMLPVGIEAADFYAPPAPPGSKLVARAWISDANLRSFSHDGEALLADGSVYLRLKGVKCWRFYVPFGEVNFHGPKDQYFLGRRWTELEAQVERSSAPGFALVRLEVPPDLKQPAMSRVTAQVTLTPTEIAEFRRRTREGDDVHAWLFGRIAAKDAVRLLWFDRTAERLFPADIEGTGDAEVTTHRRGNPAERFDGAVVARAGSLTVALATTGAVGGLSLAEREDDLEALQQRLAVEACGGGTVVSVGEAMGVIELPSGERWRVHFGGDEKHLAAWTLGEKP